MGNIIPLPAEVVLWAYQTTREYEKSYLNPGTVAPLFSRGADGPNSIWLKNMILVQFAS